MEMMMSTRTISVSNKVLNEIVEKTNISTGMVVQKIYKDTLRNLINLFGNLNYIDRNNNSVKIKCFHANQERSIAKAHTGNNITLPAITIGENSSEEDSARTRYSPILVHQKYWHKKKNRAIRILSLSPRPIKISYSINIWSKYKEDLDQIRETILLMFNPDLEIKTKLSSITKAFFNSESNIEKAEAVDQEDRILKKSITISVETYLENPRFLYTSTGKIEKLNYQISIADTNITETAQVSDLGINDHSVDCLCDDCILPIYLISGDVYNFAANCAISTGHAAGCSCSQCTLGIYLIDGQNFNITVDCNTIDSITKL